LTALGPPRLRCYNSAGGHLLHIAVESMARAYSVNQVAAVGTTAVLALSLVGCSSISGGGSGGGASDWFPSIPGFSTVQTTPADRSALAAAEALPSVDTDCPTVDIRQGASTLAIAAKTQMPTANDLRYQLSLSQLARQCALDGPMMRIRVGVQGRVVVGPAGAPNQVTVPIRYAVVQEGVEPKTITTKFRRFPVTLPPGATNVTFTDIEDDLSFPLPTRNALEAYVVYIGFDDTGDRNERRPPAKKATPKVK